METVLPTTTFYILIFLANSCLTSTCKTPLVGISLSLVIWELRLRRCDLQAILIGNRHCISVQLQQELLPSAAQTSRSLWIINPDPQQQRPCLKKQYIILVAQPQSASKWSTGCITHTHTIYTRTEESVATATRRFCCFPLWCVCVQDSHQRADDCWFEMSHCDVSLRTEQAHVLRGMVFFIFKM